MAVELSLRATAFSPATRGVRKEKKFQFTGRAHIGPQSGGGKESYFIVSSTEPNKLTLGESP